MKDPPINNLVITLAQSQDDHIVCVSIAGDVDMAGEAQLARAARQLAATCCTRVYVDLIAVTFAGSTLINFLFRLSTHLPGNASMTLCRPGVMTVQLIELTGLSEVAAVRADLPAEWTMPQVRAAEPVAALTGSLA